MQKTFSSESGVSLVETMVAMLVLTVGAIGMASVFLYGMASATSSPNELIATQKAAEAVESVFAARDTRTITWAQIQNVAQGGIFVAGPQPMKIAGADGVLNTSDDGVVETVVLPGPDQNMGGADDITVPLTGFTRQITIASVGGATDLRSITVTIVYQAGTVQRTYALTTYISAFA